MTAYDLMCLLSRLDPDTPICVPGPSGWYVPAGSLSVRKEEDYVTALTGRTVVALLVASPVNVPTGWAWDND